ncbi:MAG: hypothetical protein JSU00_14320 [Acidobacteria bacterium]|nr:hypothetical protein [Acidobacteriota bacterium]
MDKRILIATVIAGAAFLGGCSEAPAPVDKTAELKKEPPKPPEPVAGQSAFFEMYKPARQWAADVQPLTLASNDVPGRTAEGGKAWMWTAVFVSPSKREARTLFYSVVEHEKVLRGVTVGGAQTWSGATPKSKPFGVAEFQVNSDAAYDTVYKKAEAWVKKHPGKKLSIYLASTNRFPAPAWYVMWGDSKSGYLGFVNATTGVAFK